MNEKDVTQAFLLLVYEADKQGQQADIFRIGQQLGLDRPTTKEIAGYLEEHGQISFPGIGSQARLTHAGRIQAEANLAPPDVPSPTPIPAQTSINVQVNPIISPVINVSSTAGAAKDDKKTVDQASLNESHLTKKWYLRIDTWVAIGILLGTFLLVVMELKKAKNSEAPDVASPTVTTTPRYGSINQSMNYSPYGQQHVTINGSIPPPQFKVEPLEQNIHDKNIYRSSFRLVIISQVMIKAARLYARAPTAQSVEAVAQIAGAQVTGWGGKRPGYAFITIQDAQGEYIVTAMSTEPETWTLDYELL